MINQTKKIRETMSKYKLNFQLKQHTPIIHFQHDQKGATLRASELKPKLDKFLIEKLALTETIEKKGAQAVVPKKDYEHWFNNKEKLSLDYKVHIEAEERKVELDNLINLKIKTIKDRQTNQNKEKLFYTNLPGFFGNMMKEQEFITGKKKLKKVTFYDSISIYFTSFILAKTDDKTLLEAIKENFAEFLATTNFGTRQSKGFGSFTIENQIIKLDNNYYFTIPDKDGTDFKNLFKVIDLFYRCLKSGLNIKAQDKSTGKLIDKIYFKSLMFRYAKDLTPSEQWDKRTIRHALYINHWKYMKTSNPLGVYYNRTDPAGTVHYTAIKPINRKYYDFRDLLGLSTEQDWKFYHNNSNVKKEVTKGEIINGNIQNFTIDRFQSPITIKPVFDIGQKKWLVYILTKDIPKKFKNADVIVTNNTANNVELVIFPGFSIKGYLDYAISKFDKNDISYGNRFNENNTPEARIIIKVFEELKKQIE